jgi:L-cysteine desulfidase
MILIKIILNGLELQQNRTTPYLIAQYGRNIGCSVSLKHEHTHFPDDTNKHIFYKAAPEMDIE